MVESEADRLYDGWANEEDRAAELEQGLKAVADDKSKLWTQFHEADCQVPAVHGILRKLLLPLWNSVYVVILRKQKSGFRYLLSGWFLSSYTVWLEICTEVSLSQKSSVHKLLHLLIVFLLDMLQRG